MRVAHVTHTATIIVPEKGDEAYAPLYSRWYEEEGCYLAEDGEFPKNDEEILTCLAGFIYDSSHVGNETEFVSGEDGHIEVSGATS